jgi:hypothetical protein
MIPLSRRILSVETTSAMQATSKACGARSVHFVAPSQQPAPHAFETRERGEAAPALIRRGIEYGPHLQNSAFRTMGLTVA